MPIYRGTYYGRTFLFTDNDNAPINITGWEFAAQFKSSRDDAEPLVELTTANTGFVVTDGPAGKLLMNLTADDTELLTGSKAVFDVLRTDIDPGPVWLFEGSVPVKNTITQLA